MLRLSQGALDALRAVLQEEARPLERELYRHWFEGAPADGALRALAAFANADGGFGRALEADLRLPDSSAMATTMALQTLRLLGAGAEDPLVRGAVGYLVATLDAESTAWPSAPPAVNDHPHAPWWQRDPSGPAVTEGELDNPRPEVLGYLFEHSAHVTPELLARVSRSTMERFRALGDTLEMHALLCYLRLAESPGLPPEMRAELWARLGEMAMSTVERDPATWPTYCLRPLDVVRAPSAPLLARLREDVERQLDWEIERLGDTGTIDTPWDWGGLYPEAFVEARREWVGVLALETLRRLQAFGRLP